VIPYFYFRNTEVLGFSSTELKTMTPTGRGAILDRQAAIASLEVWVVGAAILIGAIGLLLLVMGALRLRSAQVREDEESDLRRNRAQLEYEEMSPSEQEEKNTEQAAVEVAEERSGATLGGVSSDAEESGQAPQVTTVDSWRQRADVIARVSSAVERAFRDREIGPYTLKWQVRIGSANDEIRLDGVFERDEPRYRDVILKIRVVPYPSFLLKSARSTANDLVATLERYKVLTGRRANGWILAVVPSESTGASSEEISKGIQSLRRAIGPWVEATLINEDEIEELPEVFAQIFNSS
jgi:hypothetical protein